MNLFESVKNAVSARSAAERYGITVNRNGMACCPFHNDSTPSMKIDERYHCFGCGADGDAINFTAQLFGLSQLDAAKKLAQDFNIPVQFQKNDHTPSIQPKPKVLNSRQAEQNAVQLLTDYLQILKKWETLYAPREPAAEWHPKFTEAMQNRTSVEQAIDIFMLEPQSVIAAWMKTHEADLEKLKQRRDSIMAEKPSNKERLKEITDSIEQGIKDLFQSDKYRQYLSVMSRFHRYSVNNTMLIFMQKPDATLVAGYNKWQNQFERHVKKGEHGITIIAPTPFKKKIEEQKLDPDTKAPMLDKDGNILTEEKEIEIPMFRPVKVFDVSQTDGKPLPQLASSLNGNVQNFDVFMEALKRSAPVPLAFEEMSKDTDGYFSPSDQRIAIRTGMSEVQTVSAAVHEITHSKLHNKEIPTEQPQWQIMMVSEGGTRQPYMGGFNSQEDAEVTCEDMNWEYADENHFVWSLEICEDTPIKAFVKKDRHTEEVEAESVSYAVCQYYGIETSENSFGYIAGWSQGKELPELKASLETINKTANELISDIDRHYQAICKERGIDPQAQAAPEAPKEEKADDSRWRCYVIPDLMTWNGPALKEQKEAAEKMIGRIDYLGLNGKVREGIEYSDAREFENDLRDDTDCGIPMSVVLYKNSDGEVIPHNFIFELDPPPKGLDIIENPAPGQVPTDRTPIEFYDTYEEAAARFNELRPQEYNQKEIINPQSNLSYARLTFGVQRENPPSAADLLHVRAGQNYLVDDFTRMSALHTSPEVMEILQRMNEDLGFDRVNRYETDSQGLLLPPVDMPFSDWENDYFPKAPEEPSVMSTPIPSTDGNHRPHGPEVHLDEYPLPDEESEPDLLKQCGYVDDDLLPVSIDRAYDLMEHDLTVYLIREGESPQLAFDTSDLDNHEGFFAVSRNEWEHSPQFHGAIVDRLDQQQEREQAFFDFPDNCFALYQVQQDDPNGMRFMNLDWLQAHNIPVSHDNYDLVYTAPLKGQGSIKQLLEEVYQQFNLDHPADYHSPSMSISDIVAIKQNGVVSCHYTDSIGFKEIPGFLPENPLKATEMTVEDDYGLIDGIINNGPKVLEPEVNHKKPSILEKLRASKEKPKKTAPHKSAERER